MLNNPEAEATIVLGSKGFLGKEITKLSSQVNLLTSIRGDTSSFHNRFGELKDLNILLKYKSILVINCTSSRMLDDALSIESNFNFPLAVLQNVSQLNIPMRWVQFDSYTQYTIEKVHDENYVKSKNLFNERLDYYFSKKVLSSLQRISLPHIYGQGDNALRFLPKMFKKILLSVNVEVISPYELLPVIDVADCAAVIKEIIFSRCVKIEESNREILSIAPTEEVSVVDFLNSFKAFSESNSKIIKGKNDINIFVEKWNSEEQPLNFKSELIRKTRDATFEDIILEMRGLI
jgi:hypothetical protein